MYNKKAQTATEYMIILAVVIIIALIVVGVLGGIPGIGGNTGSNAATAYWSTAEVGIPAFSISHGDGTNTATFTLRNNMPSTITVNNISISQTGSTSADIQLTEVDDLVLNSGETRKITDAAVTSSVCPSAGVSYTTNVLIYYTVDETGAVHTFEGSGNKLEGTCAQ